MPESREQANIVDEQKSKIEKSKEKRARSYIEILSPLNNTDEKVVERQKAVFKELPDFRNFTRLVKAGVKANFIEYPKSKVEDRQIIQGIIFEELVKIENDLFNLATGESRGNQIEKYSDVESGKVESGLDEQLTSLFHNPDRFNYFELSHLRNPDISFVETDIDGKTLKVVGVGEAKSGSKLDSRCFSQFKYFHQNLNKVANFINSRTDCEEHGLKHFGEGEDKTKIKVNEKEEFNQYLIITRDMNIDINNPQEYFKLTDQGALTESESEIFANMIQDGQIKILKSSFSHQEIKLLVKKIEEYIIKERKIEFAEFQAEQESL